MRILAVPTSLPLLQPGNSLPKVSGRLNSRHCLAGLRMTYMYMCALYIYIHTNFVFNTCPYQRAKINPRSNSNKANQYSLLLNADYITISNLITFEGWEVRKSSPCPAFLQPISEQCSCPTLRQRQQLFTSDHLRSIRFGKVTWQVSIWVDDLPIKWRVELLKVVPEGRTKPRQPGSASPSRIWESEWLARSVKPSQNVYEHVSFLDPNCNLQ